MFGNQHDKRNHAPRAREQQIWEVISDGDLDNSGL